MKIKLAVSPFLNNGELYKYCFNEAQRLCCVRRHYSNEKLYVQGQSPEPSIREYFYYIDHQGMVRSFSFILGL